MKLRLLVALILSVLFAHPARPDESKPASLDDLKEIVSNWVEDANMKADKAKSETAHPVLGRYHGFTGTNMTVAEFEKTLNSLHPIKTAAPSTERPKETGGAPELKLHPKIFSLID